MKAAKANLLKVLSVLAAAALAARSPMLVVDATTGTSEAEAGAPTRVLSDTWEWDGQAWTHLDLLSAPNVLPGLAMADNPAGGTTLLVGTDAASENFETWEFDGNANEWRKVGLPADRLSPSPRPSYAMALDRARNVVVLFGGGDATVGGAAVDTWEWDTEAKAWQVKAATGPPARTGHAMAYSPGLRPHSVLFGGVDNFGAQEETWSWNGTVWELETSLAAPPGADRPAMATLDQPLNEITILFGGLGAFCQDRTASCDGDDTWVWDGSTWMLRTPESRPPGRYGHAMAGLRRTDPSSSDVVLFGGLDMDDKVLNDTWTWTGANWQQASLFPRPPARHGHALAFNTARGKVILFGGITEATKPTISMTTPADGATYKHKEIVDAGYACVDEAGGSGLKSCVGTLPDGSPIDTSTRDTKTFTVTAEDNAGNTHSVTHTYSVTASGKPGK